LSSQSYGQIVSEDPEWRLEAGHCLGHCSPVRRNVVVEEDAVLDSTQSIVIQQAGIERMLRKRY
jgi:ornithine carbamoyltransferase